MNRETGGKTEDVEAARRWSRLVHGAGANAYSQGVTLTVQLASIPFFLSVWTPTEYGIWLILVALPSFASFCDLGVLQTISNRLAGLDEVQDQIREAGNLLVIANRIIWTACAVFSLSCILILLYFDFPAASSQRAPFAFSLLAFSAVLTLFASAYEAILRGLHHYARATYLNNTARLVEWLAWVVLALTTGSFVWAALAGIFVRLAYLALIRWQIKKLEVKKSASFKPTVADFKPHMRSSVGNLLFPVASTLAHNGLPVVIGSVMGASATAVFVTHRTLSRLAFQLGSIPVNATGVEYAKLRNIDLNRSRTKKLLTRSVVIAIATTLIGATAIHVSGEYALLTWSQGKLAYDSSLMVWLSVGAIISGAWLPLRLLLQSYETQLACAVVNVVLTGALLLSVWTGLLQPTHLVAAALVAVELLTLLVAAASSVSTLSRKEM